MTEARLATARPGRIARWQRWHRLVVVVLLGFASGLPLALTGQAMQAWLSTAGAGVRGRLPRMG